MQVILRHTEVTLFHTEVILREKPIYNIQLFSTCRSRSPGRQSPFSKSANDDLSSTNVSRYTHTHTHTHIYIYIYKYIHRHMQTCIHTPTPAPKH